ncbi:ORFa1203 [Escherichia coli]|nr:ORFa1203 [Escherichia coli]
MTKNTRFSPQVRQRAVRIVLESQGNMTHNGQQFVPLPQRLVVRRRLFVSGFASMSGIPKTVMCQRITTVSNSDIILINAVPVRSAMAG